MKLKFATENYSELWSPLRAVFVLSQKLLVLHHNFTPVLVVISNQFQIPFQSDIFVSTFWVSQNEQFLSKMTFPRVMEHNRLYRCVFENYILAFIPRLKLLRFSVFFTFFLVPKLSEIAISFIKKLKSDIFFLIVIFFFKHQISKTAQYTTLKKKKYHLRKEKYHSRKS